MPGRKWTMEEKANIVLEVLTTSAPLAEICRKYNVRPTQVYRWKASFVQAGTRGLSGRYRRDYPGKATCLNRRTGDSRKW